jgi:hypothetical protein
MVMTGGSVEAVIDRISATLLWKNVVKSSTDSSDGWSILLMVFHRVCRLFAQGSIVADQNAVNFVC